MSEYSGFILVNRNTLGPYIFVGCHRMLENSGVGLHKFYCIDNFVRVRVPDEHYSRLSNLSAVSVPDEDYSRLSNLSAVSVPDEDYSRLSNISAVSVPDEDYSRKLLKKLQ